MLRKIKYESIEELINEWEFNQEVVLMNEEETESFIVPIFNPETVLPLERPMGIVTYLNYVMSENIL